MPSLYDFYSKFWNPVCGVVSAMERAGCYFDVQQCGQAHAKAAADAEALLAVWNTQTHGVNPESPKQLSKYLYLDRKFPIPPISGTLKAVKRTKSGEMPTSEASIDWLQRHAKHPPNRELLSILLKLRKITKLAQFLQKLPDFVDPDGYLRAGFGPDTATGRLASRNPNLQNIPSGDSYGIRSCFVAPSGYKLLVCDFAALEPRILAHWLIRLFGDRSLADAINTGDLYSAVAKQTWPDKLKGIEVHEIKEHQNPAIRKFRGIAKIIVLATNYGKSAAGLAVQLNIATEEATQLLDDYFRAYPGIVAFQNWAYGLLANGGVKTFLGRTRTIDPGQTEYQQAKAKRLATNTIIQGSAADVVYAAMLKQDKLQSAATLQLQVHDELVWRIPCGSDPAPLIQCMEHPFSVDLEIALPVTSHVVNDWSQGK